MFVIGTPVVYCEFSTSLKEPALTGVGHPILLLKLNHLKHL